MTLIADAAGDLFGTTHQGGTSNAGTVFELAKSSGYSPTILCSLRPAAALSTEFLECRSGGGRQRQSLRHHEPGRPGR